MPSDALTLADPTHWSSLTDQLTLAERMFHGRGKGLVGDWLASEVDRIDDPAFAKLFTDHITIPGIAGSEFAHRHVCSSVGDLIGGIRFYGRNINSPFVEVIAHNFDDLDALRACVRAEWGAFAPRDLRVRTLPGKLHHPSARTDVTIHAARYRDMNVPDDRVRLEPFRNINDAVMMVRRRYELLAVTDSELARRISAADRDDLHAWHDAGHLLAIVSKSSAESHEAHVGLLAIIPGSLSWMEGDEVNEECVVALYSRQGYAASAQTEWAAHMALDRSRFMIGTIDRMNLASRRTAERAGRPAVLEDVFVEL